MKFLLFFALAACASYRVLPPAPLEGGVQPIPVRSVKSRLFFFKSDGEDGSLARVFAADSVVLATVARPEAGVFASGDAGHSWAFSPGAFDFREVIFAPGRIYARAAGQVWHSEDQGKSWAGVNVAPPNDRLDAMALGADGALYAAGRSQLWVSGDGALSWKPLNLQLPPQPAWRVRSIVPDPRHAHIVWVSLRTEPQGELLPRFKALLDFSSDEALSALKLADARDPAPRAVSWGAPADGVYLTQDGGGLWKKTALSLDAWIALHDGALWASAAEPILQTAALVRRYPDLAGAAERQLKGGRADAAVLRAALPFPGRDALLAGPASAALVYRSADEGASWARIESPPLPAALALRAAVEKGGQDGAHVAPRPQQAPEQKRTAPGGRAPPLHDLAPLQQGRYRGPPRQPRPDQPNLPPARAMTPDTLLAFVDPLRLLARFNGPAPLSGVSGEVAWAPVQQGWDALVSALVAESESEHEISLGPAQADAQFELLRSQDGGATWTPGAPLPKGSPQSIAAGAGALYVVQRDGRAWRIAP